MQKVWKLMEQNTFVIDCEMNHHDSIPVGGLSSPQRWEQILTPPSLQYDGYMAPSSQDEAGHSPPSNVDVRNSRDLIRLHESSTAPSRTCYFRGNVAGIPTATCWLNRKVIPSERGMQDMVSSWYEKPLAREVRFFVYN
jgi:hypothetical protein